MKNLYPNQFKTVVIGLLFLVIQSCQFSPQSWWNGQKLSSFHDRNKEVLEHLKANDPKALRMLFSKEMNAQNNSRLVEILSNHLTDNDYYLLKEDFPADSNDKVYVAYFIPKKANNKQMITLVYAKLSYGWKVTSMELEPYTINGKTAPELFSLARQQYVKGEIQAALNNISLAVTCYSPGAYWVYPGKEDATRFYGKVNAEVNKKYYGDELVLKQVPTGPMILRIYNKTMDDGTYPMIYYMTHYPLEDTTEVKKENLQVRKVIAEMMPGLDENNKYILYSAFNKQPDGYSTVAHFDMVDKVH
jgi:hypothetical protein